MTVPLVSDAAAAALPWLTVEQMIEVDRAMVEDFEILLFQMMEHAGRHLAHLARERFLSRPGSTRGAVVLAGPGGNGGGALVCARRLAAWGFDVSAFISADEGRFAEVPHHQLRVLKHVGVEVHNVVPPPAAASALIIDGLIGYSLRGAPRGRAAELIRWANQSGSEVLSLDVPSGLDATTGSALDPVIHATATMTLALPKAGLARGAASSVVGELYLADIGVPPKLYERAPLGLKVPNVFAHADIVRLR